MSQAKIKCIEIPSEIVTIISIFIIPDENMLRHDFSFVFFNNFEFLGRCCIGSVIFGFDGKLCEKCRDTPGFLRNVSENVFLKN